MKDCIGFFTMKICTLEILRTYNSEIRGFYNYYSIANNSAHINCFYYIMEYSMFKTYATKYRTTKRSIMDKMRIGKDFGIKYKGKDGIEKVCLLYHEGFRRKEMNKYADVDLIQDKKIYLERTSLIQRLSANKCEWCGKNTDWNASCQKAEEFAGQEILGAVYDCEK